MLQQILRRGAYALHSVVGKRERQIEIGALVFPADFAEGLINAGWRIRTPALVVEDITGNIPIEIAFRTTVFGLIGLASVRTAARLGMETGMTDAAFGSERQCAA